MLVIDNDAGVLLLVRLRVGKETGIDGRFLGDRMGERGMGMNWDKAGKELGKSEDESGSQGRYLREPCVMCRECDGFWCVY